MAHYPSPDELIAKARAQTGLSDFGPGQFREGLEIFLSCVARETDLDEARAAQTVSLVLRRLVNRLEIEDWLRKHPEITSLPIEGPLSIAGLPRTGTTALANILSYDDSFRPLRSWEQSKPIPPPVAGQDEADPRRLAAVQNIERIAREAPEQMAMHLFDADATEEDHGVVGLEFKAQSLVLPIVSYHAWWRTADSRPTFAYHRRVAQLLQSQRGPNRWLFKAPSHNFHFDGIVSAYPDARFIVTHRDPAKCVPSAISLIAAVSPQGPHGWEKLGPKYCEHYRIGAERALAARAKVGEHRFFDLYHHEFVSDPFGTLQRIYDFLGYELRPSARERMERWHSANRSGAHGAHRYTAEQFGLSEAQMRSDFGFYIKHFDIPLGR
jgi:hypothetical protein